MLLFALYFERSFNMITVKDLQEGDGEYVEVIIFPVSCPVHETQGDLNPWTGATEGAEETEGDRWRGRRLQNAVKSDCGSRRISLRCI